MAYKEQDIVRAAEAVAERMGDTLREKQREIVVSFVRTCLCHYRQAAVRASAIVVYHGHLDSSFVRNPTAHSLVVVVSPLIALMKDQMAALNKKGISAVFVSGDDSQREDKLVQLHEERNGKEMTQPIEAPNLAQFRLFDMFTSCTHHDVKNVILQRYQDPESCLWTVIATIRQLRHRGGLPKC